ncbi:MAG: MFS transporter [Dehalococcoidales bacterium]|nr:MFS transporter [Dehalococcoidales bacterium]
MISFMSLIDIFKPRAKLTEREVSHGLNMMTWEGIVSNGYLSITTSGFLAAYALALGADNFQIGILAALPFIMQLLQIPTVFVVEKVRRRKIISVTAAVFAQALWIPVALVPLYIDTPGIKPVSALLFFIALRFAFNAIANCSWNSWVRDLVPQQILGRFYSRRLAFSTTVAAIYGIGAAFFVDFWKEHIAPENAIYGYMWILLFGALFLACLSPYFLSRMPEPLMQATEKDKPAFWKKLLLPLQDVNFRKFIQFLFFWGLSLNIVVPFFVVYMLDRLQMNLLSVISLSVLSQVFNILFLRLWGTFSDRFGSKVVLSLCASLFTLVIFGWIFTATPDKHFLTVPLLVVLHIFFGIAAAGVTLTVSTLGMKLAPQGRATPYLTGATLATNLGAGLGPLVGGVLAKFFNNQVFTLDLNWSNAGQHIHLGVLNIAGFSFLFVVAFVFALFTIKLLTSVKEKGEVERAVVMGELLAQSRASSGGMNASPLLGITNMFPLVYLQKLPGFDVAIGVTVYQLAETTRRITQRAARSRDFPVHVTRALEKHLTSLWKSKKAIPSTTVDFAEHAARGAMQAAVESNQETTSLIHPTVTGIVNAMMRNKADPEDSVRGTTQGIIKKSIESGEDMEKIVTETIAAVREAAGKFGLDERKLVMIATHAILSEVHNLDFASEIRIRRILARQLQTWQDDLE